MNAHYENWNKAIEQRAKVFGPEKELVDIIINYERMRFWIEQAKEVARQVNFIERYEKYAKLNASLNPTMNMINLMVIARLELKGQEFTVEQFDNYVYVGKTS